MADRREPSASLLEAEARLMRARLDAMDGGTSEDVADVLAQRAEIDDLQRQVDDATELVRRLHEDASLGLRDAASDVEGLADEGWRLSAVMQLEALKEQILSGSGNTEDLMATLASLELQEAEHESAAETASRRARPEDAPLSRASMDAELEVLRSVKLKLESELDAARRLALA